MSARAWGAWTGGAARVTGAVRKRGRPRHVGGATWAPPRRGFGARGGGGTGRAEPPRPGAGHRRGQGEVANRDFSV